MEDGFAYLYPWLEKKLKHWHTYVIKFVKRHCYYCLHGSREILGVKEYHFFQFGS